MSENKNYDVLFKIILIGDTSVGKTNILSRFIRNEFDENSKSTIGVEFGTKNFNLNDKIIKAQIWDTAGQERYRSITTAYYRGAAAIIICCDITNKESFYNLNNWIEEVSKYIDKDVDKLVLLNKCDLKSEKKIDQSEISKFEKERGIKVMEVSAKTGEGIENAFQYIIGKLINKSDGKSSNTMTLQGGIAGLNKGCC